MSSLGMVVNGAQSLPRRDEWRRAPWKRLAALVMAALANPRACGFIAGGGDRDESLIWVIWKSPVWEWAATPDPLRQEANYANSPLAPR